MRRVLVAQALGQAAQATGLWCLAGAGAGSGNAGAADCTTFGGHSHHAMDDIHTVVTCHLMGEAGNEPDKPSLAQGSLR